MEHLSALFEFYSCRVLSQYLWLSFNGLQQLSVDEGSFIFCIQKYLLSTEISMVGVSMGVQQGTAHSSGEVGSNLLSYSLTVLIVFNSDWVAFEIANICVLRSRFMLVFFLSKYR